MNYKTFLIGIPIALMPLLVYILNNYIQTGNPVFPFYNKLFKSRYLENINWIEEAYGPKTLIERLFWPIYTLTDTRRTFDTDIYYGRICFGFIVAILNMIICFVKFKKKKEKNNNILYLSIIFLLLSLIWSNNMMGYIRYALILEVIAGILSIQFIYDNFNKKYAFISSVFVICSLGYTFINTSSDLFKTATELSWRYPKTLNKISYSENLKYIFSGGWDYSKITEGIDCLGVTDYNSGYAAIITDEIPIIGISESYYNDYGKKQFDKALNKCKNIYTISTSSTYDRTINYVEKFGFDYLGDERIGKSEFLNIENDLILFRIKKKEVKNER